MIRTQVSLTKDQAERLRLHSAARGLSQAEIFRQALDAYLDRDELLQRVERARAFTPGASGYSDVSENHDKHLAEIFAEDLENRLST